MHRLLLLGTCCLSATLAHGQHLLQEMQRHKHYQVYKETMSHFNANTNSSEEVFASDVNYIVTTSKEGMQMRRASRSKPMLSNTTGALVCQFTSLKYLSHFYGASMLIENYRGVHQAYLGGAVPPLRGLPNPSAVEVSWRVDSDDSRTMQVYWYYGPRKKPATLFDQSYFLYTLSCKRLD